MTAITKSVDLDRRGRVAVLTVDNAPVNALSQHVRQGLRGSVADIKAHYRKPTTPGTESAQRSLASRSISRVFFWRRSPAGAPHPPSDGRQPPDGAFLPASPRKPIARA